MDQCSFISVTYLVLWLIRNKSNSWGRLPRPLTNVKVKGSDTGSWQSHFLLCHTYMTVKGESWIRLDCGFPHQVPSLHITTAGGAQSQNPLYCQVSSLAPSMPLTGCPNHLIGVPSELRVPSSCGITHESWKAPMCCRDGRWPHIQLKAW